MADRGPGAGQKEIGQHRSAPGRQVPVNIAKRVTSGDSLFVFGKFLNLCHSFATFRGYPKTTTAP